VATIVDRPGNENGYYIEIDGARAFGALHIFSGSRHVTWAIADRVTRAMAEAGKAAIEGDAKPEPVKGGPWCLSETLYGTFAVSENGNHRATISTSSDEAADAISRLINSANARS
jgi:hypothetical protein